MPSSTPYRTPTATIHTKNSATDSTNASLSTDHGSTRLSWRLARRGPRPARRSTAGGGVPSCGGVGADGGAGGGGPAKLTVVRPASAFGRPSGRTPDWPAAAANTLVAAVPLTTGG